MTASPTHNRQKARPEDVSALVRAGLYVGAIVSSLIAYALIV
jgi:hypothetical protein